MQKAARIAITGILSALSLWMAFRHSYSAAATLEGVEHMGAAVLEKATFGGGCFWCVEAIFRELKGVESVEPGYAGGTVANPTYEQVCSGSTGHAEVAQVTFDPTVISYPDLVRVFFHTHDPTTLNRQGADTGTQYRSAIFFHSEGQRTQARQVMEEIAASRLWGKPLVTVIEPLDNYYPAEDYHRQYYERNKSKPYCQIVIAPKIAKLRKEFSAKLKR